MALRTKPAQSVDVLAEGKCGRYVVQAYKMPGYPHLGIEDSFVFRVLLDGEQVRADSRNDENKFPKQAAWCGTGMCMALRGTVALGLAEEGMEDEPR